MRLFNIFYINFKSATVLALCCVATCSLVSCKKLLSVDPPPSNIVKAQVFADDLTAIAAGRGLYADMLGPEHFSNGRYNTLMGLTGLSADELLTSSNEAFLQQFQNNALSSDNTYSKSLWTSMYKSIYDANSVIEGVNSSEAVSISLKNQLTGEALFIRAFAHFYLVNLFGDVPIILTTDYKFNRTVGRQPVTEVYNQVIKDLLASEQMLGTEFRSGERVYINQQTVFALLARVYLYTEKWAEAELQATKLIDNQNYSLVELNEITLANNNEAIWQLHPSVDTYNAATNEGIDFNYPEYYNSLRSDLVNSFESSDNRKAEWVVVKSGLNTSNKYQSFGAGGPRGEYSTVFRLAEQYLIRAEARVQQNKLVGDNGAQSDINKIRDRAGLTETTAETKEELLLAIEQERRVELFAEWGHRWLDLKRWNRANQALSTTKGANWQSSDQLYPIPQSELNLNPFLKTQNPSY